MRDGQEACYERRAVSWGAPQEGAPAVTFDVPVSAAGWVLWPPTAVLVLRADGAAELRDC